MSSIRLSGVPTSSSSTRKDEPGVSLRPLRLVADVWARRRSGLLIVPAGLNRPRRQLRFVDGALADRMAFMYLNAAMHCEELLFEDGPAVGRSDRAAVARLLMDRARTMTRSEVGRPYAQDQRLVLDPTIISALPLPLTAMSWLLVRANLTLPMATLNAALQDAELGQELRALTLLGFLQPPNASAAVVVDVVEQRATAPSSVGSRLTLMQDAPHVETFEDHGAFLRGFAVDERVAEHIASERDPLDDLLEQARERMTLRDWAGAYDLCVAAHGRRLDDGNTLAHLAVACLYADREPWNLAADRARRYAETAVVLEPTDSLVRRLAAHVEQAARGPRPEKPELDWLEHAEVLSLSLA